MPRKVFLLDNEEYLTYEIAERLGKTVEELLTGHPGPLSAQEFVNWSAFYTVRADRQRQVNERNG